MRARAAAVTLLLQADVQDFVAHKAAMHGRYARARPLEAGVVHEADAPALPRRLVQHHLQSTAWPPALVVSLYSKHRPGQHLPHVVLVPFSTHDPPCP